MSKFATAFEQFRDRLAFGDATPQLVVLGLLTGAAAGLLIVLFRLAIDLPLSAALGDVDGFESLPPQFRFLLPFLGALTLGLALHFVQRRNHAVSVTHVLDRLHQHQGKLPLGNLFVQFFGGVIALVSGQSLGREGPGIHLGAGAASQIGQWLRLPNNSLRTLVACGVAAAISTSFNTPMAGVIFAMEVILMEYTITGFVPVIIAAVTGAVISQLVFGPQIALLSVETSAILVAEMPFLILAGLMISIAAMGFIWLYLRCLRFQHLPVALRFTLVGLLTGVVAVFVPQVMGIGYDTLNQAMAGELAANWLLYIVVAKLLVTAMATGLGMLGGLIGPTLVIGGCLGGLLGVSVNNFSAGVSPPEVYVMLGMMAMMGAVLNAPLAALVAILELSDNPDLIFPGMLIVVVACLGVQLTLGYRGIFAEHLRQHGFDLYAGPGKVFLSRVGLRSLMTRSVTMLEPRLSLSQAKDLLVEGALWLAVREGNSFRLLATADLARHIETLGEGQDLGVAQDGVLADSGSGGGGNRSDATDQSAETLLDLLQIPAPNRDVDVIDSLATLLEASEKIKTSGADALLVRENRSYPSSPIVGVLTRETILENYGM